LSGLELGLDLKPWDVSPLNAGTVQAPAYMKSNELAVASWRRAWEWRVALDGRKTAKGAVA